MASREQQQSAIDIVDVAGLAERLDVPVADVKRAVKSGQLQPGRHYFLIGDKVRFRWRAELIMRLEEDCALAAAPVKKNADSPAATEPDKPSVRGVNKDYFTRKGKHS